MLTMKKTAVKWGQATLSAAAAWIEGGLSSKVGAWGILKKVGYMALIGSLMRIFGDLYERQSFKPCRY